MSQRIQNSANAYSVYPYTLPAQSCVSAPVFTAQAQPTQDSVQFSQNNTNIAAPKEESFFSKNWGKLLIGAGLLATVYATHGKSATEAQREASTLNHSLPPMELTAHEPVSNIGDNLSHIVNPFQENIDEVSNAAEHQSSKLSTEEKEEIENFLQMNKGLSSDYLKIQKSKVMTDSSLSFSESLKQQKFHRIAIRKAERAEREAANFAPKEVSVPSAPKTIITPETGAPTASAKTNSIDINADETSAVANAAKGYAPIKSEIDELEKFIPTLGATDRIARNITKQIAELKKATTKNEAIKALIKFRDLTEKILTDERMTGNCNNKEELDKRIYGILQKMGVTEIAPQQGADFDVNIHHILEMVPTDNAELHDKVEGIVEKGYVTVDGRVARNAKVFCFKHNPA